VLGDYKSFIVNMHANVLKKKLALENLELLCNLELVLGIPCILPMSKMVHTLIKFIQK
jgi:hypothetical protein